MTAKRLLVLICCSLFLLSGCQNDNQPHSPMESSDTTVYSNSNITSATQNNIEKIDIRSLEPSKGGYSEYDNLIEYYTEEEAGRIVTDTTNFSLSSECYFSVPKNIDHISTFVKRYSGQDSLYNFYRSYLEMYKYLFPEAKFDDNNLFYFGTNSNNQNGDEQVKTIGKNFSEFMNEDKKDIYFMFYSPHFYEGQPISDDKHNHFLELSSPVGTIMTNFNKGYLAEYISESNQTPNEYFLETYTSPYLFSSFNQQTGSFAGFDSTEYDVNSDTVHTMLDGKELSVSDAVSFFEDYINTLPYPQNPNLDMRVVSVSADKIDDEKFCYAFECTVAFEGIPFDYIPYGTSVMGSGNNGYEPSVRMGYMSVSDDVDAAYGFCRSVEVSERIDVSEIVSFENALECCENSMSDFAEWELQSAELVYCAGNGKKAESPYQDTEYTVSPNYKFVMLNPNDNLYYSAYVNAITGEFVRYYTTRS